MGISITSPQNTDPLTHCGTSLDAWGDADGDENVSGIVIDLTTNNVYVGNPSIQTGPTWGMTFDLSNPPPANGDDLQLTVYDSDTGDDSASVELIEGAFAPESRSYLGRTSVEWPVRRKGQRQRFHPIIAIRSAVLTGASLNVTGTITPTYSAGILVAGLTTDTPPAIVARHHHVRHDETASGQWKAKFSGIPANLKYLKVVAVLKGQAVFDEYSVVPPMPARRKASNGKAGVKAKGTKARRSRSESDGNGRARQKQPAAK